VPWVNRFDREVDRAWRQAQRDGRKISRERVGAEVFVRMTNGGEVKSGTKADIVFVIDINAYRRGHAHDGEVCHIIGGGPIPVDIVREMMRDAFVKAALHDGVNIHTIKHFGRYRKAELQTALDLGTAPRFEGAVCSEPRCNRRYHLQWDHKDPVANDGPTSFENLQGLCGTDHDEKTQRDCKAGKLRRKRGPPTSRAA